MERRNFEQLLSEAKPDSEEYREIFADWVSDFSNSLNSRDISRKISNDLTSIPLIEGDPIVLPINPSENRSTT
ncbi:MAG TPA: hypothetical protein VMR41_01755 [Patescibacteria group bacterium]|nr:hypothetical protein [Patescibacteria group bacterium]